jgi:aspartate-semialdehyde dehydrogenase
VTTPDPSAVAGRLPVAVLGATGAVGQTFIRLLATHPWFVVSEVAASERSVGKSYAEATRWLEGELPPEIAALRVAPCTPDAVASGIVFSALDSGVAGEIEAAFAHAGRMVLSNAKNYRMDDDVPLVIPEVNGHHLEILETQRKHRGWSGGIVTNANCAATVAAVALAPLHETFGLRTVFAATMQAVSGAGYPGVPSLDALGNVIPYIADEEPKIERELPKMLGRFDGGRIIHADFKVTAHANRVPGEHGHTVVMSCAFANPPRPEEAVSVLRRWRGRAEAQRLPSAPTPPIVVDDAPDRPQARRDVNRGGGMAVSVGRVRADPVFDLRLVALGHNTIRGAAGGSILNAEWLAARGALPRR